MARQPSLRSQLNLIRSWVRQGRTDAWIAHQLDISVEQLERFKSDHDLEELEPSAARAVDPLSVPMPEVSLETGDDEEEDNEEEDEPVSSETEPDRDELVQSDRRGRSRQRRRSNRGERDAGGDKGRSDRERARAAGSADRQDREGDDRERRRRRRGRRGGRRQRKIPTYEATFDHGDEGYGLWLDPAIVDNPIYSQYWAGKRAIEVRFDPDTITIRRATRRD